ncbi:MAG: tRNA lysidine(34) synthetase TilS [Rickettsiales bacterium]|nr:tRNA lysidine(34) synthetase TilS [Rickettsiales bacterium]
MKKYSGRKIAVAVSGGVDSVTLLHWLARLNFDLIALHVNHGLRAAAKAEEEYVRRISAGLGVPCAVFHWTGPKPASGLESAARDARYKLMTDYCRAQGIDILVTAHQADDQIETFLMNLGRGSGVYGLAAMRAESTRDGIIIARPLLTVFRSELAEYCNRNNIGYFSDEMNDDERYTRVRIRKNRRLLNDEMGISDSRILLAIRNLSRTRQALDEYVASRAAGVLEKDYARFNESFLFDEPPDIRLRLLGTIIQNVGENSYNPRLNSLEKALDGLLNNCKFTLGRCTLRRLGDDILIVPEGSSASFGKRK